MLILAPATALDVAAAYPTARAIDDEMAPVRVQPSVVAVREDMPAALTVEGKAGCGGCFVTGPATLAPCSLPSRGKRPSGVASRPLDALGTGDTLIVTRLDRLAMVTRRMRERLRALGLADEDIAKLTPAEAHARLDQAERSPAQAQMAAAPTDGGDEPGLSKRRIAELVRWLTDAALI
jgi:hypothetical protein